MGALALHNAIIWGCRKHWHANPERTYRCRYCDQSGLKWVWYSFGWRLTTDGRHALHDCPQFSARRRLQFQEELAQIRPKKVKIRPAVIIRRFR